MAGPSMADFLQDKGPPTNGLNWPRPDDNAAGRVYEPWRIDVLRGLKDFPYRVFPEGSGVPYTLPNDARKWTHEDWGRFVDERYMDEWLNRNKR